MSFPLLNPGAAAAAGPIDLPKYDPVFGDMNIDTYDITINPGICSSTLSQIFKLKANNEFLLGFSTALWAMFPTAECNDIIEINNSQGYKIDVNSIIAGNGTVLLEGKQVSRIVNDWYSNGKWRKSKATLISFPRKEAVVQYDTTDFYHGVEAAFNKLKIRMDNLGAEVNNRNKVTYIL